MRKTRVRNAALSLLAALLGATLALSGMSSVSAQEGGLAIRDMMVSFWPEYDNPRVLIIYQGEFAGDWDSPQEVRFNAPKGSEIGQVCALNQGQHLCQLYTVEEGADHLVISYKLPYPTFYLEVYAPLSLAEAERSFSYDFVALYPIERMALSVQQPLRSSNFHITPAGGYVSSDNQGFKYTALERSDLGTGEVVPIALSYTKQDRNPSLSPGGGGLGGGWIALLVLLSLGVLAAGFWLLFLRRPRIAATQQAPSRSVRRQQVRAAGRPAAPAGPRRGGAPAHFCTDCGRELEASHQFCPTCGKRVKR